MTRRIALVPLLALGAAACVQREPPGEPGQESPPVRITMERGPCFGACPTYRVTIDGDGLVRFEPLGRMRGSPDSTRVAPETALRLAERFERDGFFALADRYEHGTPGSDRFRTDQPSAVLRVERGGGVKEVRHSHGCDDAPPVLSALEAAVDSAAGVARWTGDVTPR